MTPLPVKRTTAVATFLNGSLYFTTGWVSSSIFKGALTG